MANDPISGFCIPYTVRDTPDKGRGVFAEAPVRAATILWRHVQGNYAVYDERSLMRRIAGMSRREVAYELEHMFGLPEFSGYVIRVFDDGVLINHSRQPTVALNQCHGGDVAPANRPPRSAREVDVALLDERFSLIATRDLEPGDELTQDYNIGIEDPPYYDALCAQFGVSSPWL